MCCCTSAVKSKGITDPVCGMAVNTTQAAGESKFQGQTFTSATRLAKASSIRTRPSTLTTEFEDRVWVHHNFRQVKR
jgi:hypothetical protein